MIKPDKTEEIIGLEETVAFILSTLVSYVSLQSETRRFEVHTDAGKKARDESVQQLQNEIDSLRKQLEVVRADIEVKMIAHVASKYDARSAILYTR